MIKRTGGGILNKKVVKWIALIIVIALLSTSVISIGLQLFVAK